jgi:hypothetical protein
LFDADPGDFSVCGGRQGFETRDRRSDRWWMCMAELPDAATAFRATPPAAIVHLQKE